MQQLTDRNRQAYQTVLLAIFVLCMFGTICSFPTNWLHRIILWFAPINSKPRKESISALSDNKQSLHQSASVSLFSFSHRTNKARNGCLQPSWTARAGEARAFRSFLGMSELMHAYGHVTNHTQFPLCCMDDDRLRRHNTVGQPYRLCIGQSNHCYTACRKKRTMPLFVAL